MTNNTNAPTEWVTGPRVATQEMRQAAVVFANGNAVYKNVAAGVLKIEEDIYGEVYAAMLEAAPPAPEAEARRALSGSGVTLAAFDRAIKLAHGIGGPEQVEQPERKGVEWLPIAGQLREPKNGDGWRVEWWNESARLLLPDGMKLYRFQPFRNGTLIFTIKAAPPAGTNTTEG